MTNKIIPTLFLDENETNVQWIANENWDYQTKFIVSKEKLNNQNIEFIFEGLGTFS